MTVSTTSNKVSFSANGSTTVFAYNFKIFADADLTVIIRAADGTETTKTLTTHYTVSGAGSASGGNVTFTSGNTPANGETVVIARQLTKTQGTDYVANDPFPAESHEDALDRLTFITQELQEEVDRSIKASVTNTITSTEFTISATDRANKIFAFDSSGDLAVTQEIGTFRGNWAASTDYNQRDLVKDTSTNNIFIVNTAHTSSGAQPLTTNANSAKYDLIVDAATATSAQTAAASSASSASTSASTATTKAAEAATSAAASAASATAAAASETAAAASETASAASETASAASETASAASQTAAAASATSASSSASTATTKASEASTSASTATTKASEAASSQTAAASSASSASTSAGTATTKAGEASTSATNAASSATAAASSATAAAASQTAAAASASSAASSFDSFDDRYHGSLSSNPSTDPDGNALAAGMLYFNNTANEMRVYDGANWIAATSAGNVSLILYEYTATAGQTTFSGSDDNSATLSYTVDNLQVVMNGVVLDPSDFTATNGTSVVLASGAAANDLVNIYAFKSFTTADMVSASAGGTFTGNVTFTNNATVNGAFTSQGIDDNANATAITIDSSENVLVNTTGTDPNNGTASGDAGAAIRSDGRILNGVYQDFAADFNRIDNHGEIVRLSKDGTTVGVIGTQNWGIGTSSPSDNLSIVGSQLGGTAGDSEDLFRVQNPDVSNTTSYRFHNYRHTTGTSHSESEIRFQRKVDATEQGYVGLRDQAITFGYGTTERMRLTGDGHFLHGKTSKVFSQAGTHLYPDGEVNVVKSTGIPFYINRLSDDGTLVSLHQAGTQEGTISVSGSTVSYNGGHLSRWSQAADGNRIDGLVKGTVMTNLDQMAVWSHDEVLWTADDDLPEGVSVGDVRTAAYTEDNEQLNCMAVSSVEGDANVAGVFVNWDEDDDFNDMNVAMTGDMVIRIAQGTTVARGDLLMSAGDGTAKPQGDDIVRSKTIAKVTSTTVSHTYDDGSYLVPCVLMAC